MSKVNNKDACVCISCKKSVSLDYNFCPACGVNLSASRADQPSVTSHKKSHFHTPLIGRDIELKRLHSYWAQACQGKTKIISIAGEPGIGKTRLIDSFESEVVNSSMVWIRGSCVAHHSNSAFQPWREMWFRTYNVNPHMAEDELVKTIKEKIKGTSLDFEDLVPLLLGKVEKEAATPHKYQSRNQIAKVCFKWMCEASIDKPLVFVLEDLHYIDPSSLEVLAYLVDNLGPQRLLLICSFRPDFLCSWSAHKSVSTINLNRLSPHETQKIVEHHAGEKEIPLEVIKHVVEKTDGVPLFIEELVTTLHQSNVLIEEGKTYVLAKPLDGVEIPLTLHDLLMNRLNKLGESKKLALICSVFGHSFTHNYLRIISGYDEAKLTLLIDELVKGHVISKRTMHGEVIYLFRHMLMHEAAYELLEFSERQHYHVEIADMLINHFPHVATQHPEVVAKHYQKGGFIDQAVEYYLRAGLSASARLATHEAIHHLNKGLKLVERLPAGEGRDRRELPIRAALCMPLMIGEGWGSDAALHELERAYDLCQKLGDTEHLTPILRGLQAFYVIRGPLSKSHAYGKQLLALARQFNDQSLLLETHRALGHCMYFEGDIAGARKHLEEALKIYEPALHKGHAFHYGAGADPKVMGLSVLAWISAVTGKPETALEMNKQAIEYAENLGHPFSLVYAYGFTITLYQNIRDYEMVEKYARLTCELAEEGHFPYWQIWGRIFLGWVNAFKLKGRVPNDAYFEALNTAAYDVKQALKEYRASGSEQGVPYALGILAQIYIELKDFDQAISLMDEALDHAQKYDIHLYDSGIIRIKADALWKSKGAEAIEVIDDLYKQSNDITHKHGMKVTRMKALLSKYAFYETMDREAELVPAIKELYDSFNEGFTILPDLVQAHKIINEK